MKFTGFATSCIGKFLLVVLCILLGVVLTLGGTALAGYIILTKEGFVGTVDDSIDAIELDDEIREMSILEWGQEIMGMVGSLSENKIGSLERMIGMNIISDTLEDMMGVSADIIKESTLEDIGPTITDNLTVYNAKEKFGISLPDMPIFNDDSFLQSPLATAFEDFNDYCLKDVIEINDESSAVLQELADVKISELGGSTTDEKIKGMFLCELMTIDHNSNKTLQALKYACVESVYETDSSGNIVVDGEGNKVFKEKTIKDPETGEDVTKPLKGLSEAMDELCIGDVVEINEGSNVILRKMRTPTEEEIEAGLADKFGTEDLLIKDLGGEKVNNLVQSAELGELFDIYEADEYDSEGSVVHGKSSKILIALKHTAVGELDADIKGLTISDIFEESQLESGAITLIPADTTIDEIPSAMTAAMTNANVATLMGTGVVEKKEMDKMLDAQKAFILNSSIGDLLSGVIDFVGAPYDADKPIGEDGKPNINYKAISPKTTSIEATEFTSLTDFVMGNGGTYYGYDQFDSLDFGGNAEITIHVDPVNDAQFLVNVEEGDNYYGIPLFNIVSETTLTFVVDGTGKETVKMAVYEVKEEEGVKTYTLSRHQYGYAFLAQVDGAENTSNITFAFENPTASIEP